MNIKVLKTGGIIIVISLILILIYNIGLIYLKSNEETLLFNIIMFCSVLGSFILVPIGIIILIVGAFMKSPKSPEQRQMEYMSSNRYCPNCGRIIPFEAKICPFCGRNFEKSQ